MTMCKYNEKDSYKITIVILTCNRNDMVMELLIDLQKQTMIKSTEIIVVDNGSSDSTYEMLLQSKYVDKIIRLNDNIGCAGRNEGIKQAGSELIVTLDDDVFFNSSDELVKIYELFKNNPDIHVLNFKILYHDSKEIIPFNWYHPRDYIKSASETFLTDYISEGAVAFRKKCFTSAGYYPHEFFLSHEGLDLALRLINNNFNIYYTGCIEVLHKCSKIQRTTWRNTYYDTRNYIWLIIRNYPFPALLGKCLFRLITTFILALSKRQFIWYLRAVRDSLIGLPAHYALRNVLTESALYKIKEIRRLQPNLFLRCFVFIRKLIVVNKTLSRSG